ncbi:MAG: DUF305 domain-containing protein [Acidobacteriia bacterium]|nr:DUF305 domain-containing protein [Terriglobia bacterium]
MKMTLRLAVLMILILAAALPAWQQDSHSHSRKTIAGDPYWSELIGSMDKMHAAMTSVETSGDSDVDFVRLMLPHHQAAIDMAKAQLAYGKDPQMRRLAQEIVTDQQSEIELMRLWLKRHEAASQKTSQTPAVSANKEH